VQLSALPVDQDSVTLPLKATDVVFDERLTVIGVGVEVTLTFTVLLIVSVLPSQLRVKLRLAVSELMICDPDLPLLPLQSPDAVQLSALLVDQDSVTLPL
jgi:hypothetical protein